MNPLGTARSQERDLSRDLGRDPDRDLSRDAAPARATSPAAEPAPVFDLIELMFFAYRDFVGDADRLLDSYRFGRAHHRVLHFVHRHPGLTVAELLDILRITKQSLNRVMKDLLDAGFIEVRSGAHDRRQRLLHSSPEGDRLAGRLAAVQSRRFRAALEEMPAGTRALASDFLLRLVDAEDRAAVRRLIGAESAPAERAARP